MKYKVGDRVRIKSLDWYNKNQIDGIVTISNSNGDFNFTKDDTYLCGQILTIEEVLHNECYILENDLYRYFWVDEMIEGLVEEEAKPNIIKEAKTYWDSIKDAWICPDGYQFKDENGNVINATKIVLEKKKTEYPKTYAECCDVLRIPPLKNDAEGYKWELLVRFQEILIARDAYWKIAGEEMGLGKPWKPDWTNLECDKFCIWVDVGDITLRNVLRCQHILAFPTEEMRDAFYENFNELIEQCKELL